MLSFDPKEATLRAKIKVIGIGGGGSNAVSYMMRQGLRGVLAVAANTDLQALMNQSEAEVKIPIGQDLTKGLGAGGDPDIGRLAMEESQEEIREVLKGADMVFLTAGMGGGTGTGGIPVAAQIARSEDILTVAVVTKPFFFEGPKRRKRAEEGLEALKNEVDTLIVIPNDRLLEVVDKSTLLTNAFERADMVLYQAVKGIVDIVTRVGLVNVDFADVRAVMKNSGSAVMGMGVAEGEDRGIEAAKASIFSPLLDGANIKGARWILVSVVAGPDLTLYEIQSATGFILNEAAQDGVEPELILGVAQDENLEGKIQLTVIATGIGEEKGKLSRMGKSPLGDKTDLGIPAFIRKGGKRPSGGLFDSGKS